VRSIDIYGVGILSKDDDDWVQKCITLEVEGARQRDRGKRGKRVVHNDTIDLHLQVMLQTVVNGGILVRGNWSYSSNDSDAVS